MRTVKIVLLFFLGLTFPSLLVGCFKKNTINENDPRIVAEVERQVAAFKKEKNDECQRRVLERATAKTDSVLMERAQFLLQRDSLSVPPRPTRPEKPSLKPEKEALFSHE